MTLPLFSQNGSCPKCRHVVVTTAYKSDSRHYYCSIIRDDPPPSTGAGWDAWQVYRARTNVEHLERTCGRCAYGWAEAVLSSPARARHMEFTAP